MRNDQALQMLFLFEGNRIVSYVWDSNAPEGTVVDESVGWPINLRVKVLVVETGTAPHGPWRTVSRNIVDDYRWLFHEEPGALVGMRIQSNSQYTGGSAAASVRRIVFSGS